jgi:hypothetical protein
MFKTVTIVAVEPVDGSYPYKAGFIFCNASSIVTAKSFFGGEVRKL